jgi:hypothetical protein
MKSLRGHKASMKLTRTILLTTLFVLMMGRCVLAGTSRIAHYDGGLGCTYGDQSPSAVNQSSSAWLSWSDNYEQPLVDLNPVPVCTQYLYVQLSDLDQFSGCEFCIFWSPPCAWQSGNLEYLPQDRAGPPDPDYPWTLIDNGSGGGFYTSRIEQGEGYCFVAGAIEDCSIEFDRGNIMRIGFDFGNTTSGVPGTFQLEYVKVTDCQARITHIEVIGGATLLGGLPDDAPLPTRRATWGAVKSSYGH